MVFVLERGDRLLRWETLRLQFFQVRLIVIPGLQLWKRAIFDQRPNVVVVSRFVWNLPGWRENGIEGADGQEGREDRQQPALRPGSG